MAGLLLDKSRASLHALLRVRRFLYLLVTLLVLVSGPLSMPGVRVERAARALAEAIETQTIAAKDAQRKDRRATDASGTARQRLTSADVGDETTRPLAGKVRSSTRASGGWLGVLSQALGDSAYADTDEIDTTDLPSDAESDGWQPFTVVTFSELHLLGPAATLVEPNLWGIQPAIGHPLGVDEPPRA